MLPAIKIWEILISQIRTGGFFQGIRPPGPKSARAKQGHWCPTRRSTPHPFTSHGTCCAHPRPRDWEVCWGQDAPVPDVPWPETQTRLTERVSDETLTYGAGLCPQTPQQPCLRRRPALASVSAPKRPCGLSCSRFPHPSVLSLCLLQEVFWRPHTGVPVAHPRPRPKVPEKAPHSRGSARGPWASPPPHPSGSFIFSWRLLRTEPPKPPFKSFPPPPLTVPLLKNGLTNLGYF